MLSPTAPSSRAPLVALLTALAGDAAHRPVAARAAGAGLQVPRRRRRGPRGHGESAAPCGAPARPGISS